MTISFRTLFTVSITHDYYGGACPDFDFLVPADTAQLLKNCKMTVRGSAGKLQVMYATENGNTLMAATGKTLRLGMKLLNPYFSNFTDLGSDFKEKIRVYRNSAAATALAAPVPYALVGRLFSHELSGAARPVTVTLKDPGGNAIQEDTITAANDRTTVSYDLSLREAGPYVVEAPPAEPKPVPYYVDGELLQQGVFGVVEIAMAPGIYQAAPEFKVAFNAKEEVLKYYLVTKNYSSAELDQLAIEDTGAAEDGRPPVTFKRAANDKSPALLGVPENQVVLFISESAVPRRAVGRRQIKLSKNGVPLITNLPQVGADKVDTDIMIQISK